MSEDASPDGFFLASLTAVIQEKRLGYKPYSALRSDGSHRDSGGNAAVC
jgi:hypothetical protein